MHLAVGSSLATLVFTSTSGGDKSSVSVANSR